MFDLNRPDTLFYLERGKLSAYVSDSSSPSVFEFANNLVANQEILDKEQFSKALNQFLVVKNLTKTEALLVLGEDVIFTKDFKKGEEIGTQALSSFLSEVPFSSEKILYKKIEMGDSVSLVATNKEIFELLQDLLAKEGGKISAVIPAICLVDTSKIGQHIQEILGSKQLVEKANMLEKESNKINLTVEQVLEDSQVPEIKKEDRKKFNLAFPIIIAVVVIGLAAAYFFLVYSPESNQNSQTSSPSGQNEVTPTPLPTATPTPSVESKEKSKLVVKILNSTTKSGFAGQVGKLLEAEGYENIKTGNAETKNQETTTIKIKESEKTYLEEVSQLINDKYDIKIESSFLSPDETEDIIITLGLDSVE